MFGQVLLHIDMAAKDRIRHINAVLFKFHLFLRYICSIYKQRNIEIEKNLIENNSNHFFKNHYIRFLNSKFYIISDPF